MQFTFRRDDEGRETIDVDGLTIARLNNDHGFEWLNWTPGITADHVREAIDKADEADFWTPLLWLPMRMPKLPSRTDVEVPVAATTSTILSVDNSEEQA